MSISNDSSITMSKDTFESDGLADGQLFGDGDVTPGGYETSPYADAEILCLHVGPDATPYHVHASFLNQSPPLIKKFEGKNGINQRVNLPELDEATAHTLVNYLYTKKYQTLRLPQTSYVASAKNFAFASLPYYKLSTCTYCAAVSYALPGLAELAKERIASLSEDVDIFDILDIARDHAYPILPENDEWYSEYLEGVIRSVMKEDAKPFLQPEFLGRVNKCSRLLQVVWNTMMSGFVGGAPVPTAAMPVLVPTETIKDEPDFEHEVKDEESIAEAASSIDVSVAQTNDSGFAEAPKSGAEHTVMPMKTPEPEELSLKLDDMEPIEPILRTPSAPEHVTDEIDFNASKMSQQWSKKSDQPPVSEKVVVKLPEQLKHVRSDSVLEKETVNSEEVKAAVEVEAMKVEQDQDFQESVKEIQPAVTEDLDSGFKLVEPVVSHDVEDTVTPFIVDGTTAEANEAPATSKKDKKKQQRKKKNSIMF